MRQQIRIASYYLMQLDQTKVMAEERTRCKRKGVGCALHNYTARAFFSNNGPARPNFGCLNIPGKCGCVHSEPRVVMNALRAGWKSGLIMTCTYSPCETCANIIIDSGVVAGVVYDIMTTYPDRVCRGAEFLRSVMPVITALELKKFLADPATEVGTGAQLREWESISPVSK